ncbi:GMC oxidoreductase [Nitrosococcus oceani]|uniref:GMC oxidoreductase n=1 Tax=Nitrosococcus oceani TaxID=1229 RepID=UPI00068AFAE0|nr:GMC family oxidoreductase [Nitrosococcus oceani]
MDRLQEVKKAKWDVIVVGTGIGGGTIGYALAKAGFRVLFLEKGRNSHLADYDDTIDGEYAENFLNENLPKEALPNRRILRQTGRYSDLVYDATASPPYAFSPFIGEGSGGSSALYGMVMERFFPNDFSVKPYFHDAPGASLPEAWPVDYNDLRPYYRAAESLYRVRGELDPLRQNSLDSLISPPPLSAPSHELFEFLKTKGLHPYTMPMAYECVPDCQECIGYLCPKECKNDSMRICIAPAIKNHLATLLDNCAVSHLEATQERVTAVWCTIGQEKFSLEAKVIILAAGALHTPSILLRSQSPLWPNGLANTSGLVGKNLMRHYFDLYCVKTEAEVDSGALIKQIAFNDLYCRDDHKLGTVQAVGRLAPSGALVKELHDEIHRKGNPVLATFIRSARPIIKMGVERFISSRLILTAIMEDLPYEDNQVQLANGGNGIKIKYTIHAYDKKRINLFRQKVKALLHPLHFTFVKNAENNERLAHACGTCRFGNDPATSVLDAKNRTHDLDNIYIVDASFFPTASGINPSLTIAANALRVADKILATLKS